MTTSRAALSAFALSLVLLTGCGPTSPTSAPPPPSSEKPREKERDVHVNTPGANIDIKGKSTTGGDHKVDVHVSTKP